MSSNSLITDKTNRHIYLAHSADFLVARDSTAADTHPSNPLVAPRLRAPEDRVAGEPAGGDRQAAVQAGGDSASCARSSSRTAGQPTPRHRDVLRMMRMNGSAEDRWYASARISALWGPQLTKRTTPRSTSVRHMSEGFRPLSGCGTIVSTLPPIY